MMVSSIGAVLAEQDADSATNKHIKGIHWRKVASLNEGAQFAQCKVSASFAAAGVPVGAALLHKTFPDHTVSSNY